MEAQVLYVDHAGHPAPLSLCYHATASRLLSSSIEHRAPPSTTTEVDSAYCPQCLTFHDAASALMLGRCPKPHCRSCPLCEAVLSIAILDDDDDTNESSSTTVCLYKCGYCQWTSQACGIVSTTTEPSESLDKTAIAALTEALGESLETRLSQDNAAPKDHVGTMIEEWRKQAKEEERRKRHGGIALAPSRGSAAKQGRPDSWSMETLEQQLKDRKEQQIVTSNAARLTVGTVKETAISSVSPEQIARQSVLSPKLPMTADELLPIPIALRAKKSRRCRAELAAGRPGILVKPKPNPLEGDSSLRSGHGQWWKKDSSAIHAVPRVRVVRDGSNFEGNHVFLLKVKNPTLGPVRLRFHKPNESVSLAASDIQHSSNGSIVLDQVTCDSIGQHKVTAQMHATCTQNLAPTESVELDPVEDAFLELGRGRNNDPVQVQTWMPRKGTSEGIQFLEQQRDSAWFQLVVTHPSSPMAYETNGKTLPIHLNALSLQLQVEVGNNSWESSLIKPKPPAEGEKHDFVSLDLILVWESPQT
uniref:Dynactin subunit 4 n=1 Tax=Attheya septentrionalis TaxID=420275 RepID=A0A7S2UH53_9STRA|mmetsp:Transcript_23063/g.41624  ORF Transcript_23063/g.41624 Transcript_23063/m.41624 type:complete len:531 (+) Transcript_23063:142-1734(+)